MIVVDSVDMAALNYILPYKETCPIVKFLNQLHTPPWTITKLPTTENVIRPLTSIATTPNAQAVADADPSKYETSICVHFQGIIGMGSTLRAMSYFSSLFFKSQGPSPNKGMKDRLK